MLKLSVVDTGMAVIDVRNGSFARPIVSCLRLIVGLFRGYDDCALSEQDLIGIFEDVFWAEFGHWNARFSALCRRCDIESTFLNDWRGNC